MSSGGGINNGGKGFLASLDVAEVGVGAFSCFEAASRVSAEGLGGRGINKRVTDGTLVCLGFGDGGESGEVAGLEGWRLGKVRGARSFGTTAGFEGVGKEGKSETEREGVGGDAGGGDAAPVFIGEDHHVSNTLQQIKPRGGAGGWTHTCD